MRRQKAVLGVPGGAEARRFLEDADEDGGGKESKDHAGKRRQN